MSEPTSNTNAKRIVLLPDAEVKALYARPEFNSIEQALYFSLSQDEYSASCDYGSLRTQLYFILQLGYFKAKQQFFDFSFEQVAEDIQFIAESVIHEEVPKYFGKISRQYIRRQRLDILKLLNHHEWTHDFHDETVKKIEGLLRYHPRERSALRQLLVYFDHKNMMIPSYRILQDMFTLAVKNEQNRIAHETSRIPKKFKSKIDRLIKNNDGVTQLNLVRADQKDFQYTAIKQEIEKVDMIEDLYHFSKEYLPSLMISKNAIRYYAGLIDNYPASRLRKLKKYAQLIYTICFIYHRYQQIMDNLIISFTYHVKSIVDAGKTYADLAMLEHSSKLVVDFPKLAKFLDWFPARDQGLSYDQINDVAFDILPQDQFSALSNYLKGNSFDKDAAKWAYYLTSARSFSLYLRPIFLTVNFQRYKIDKNLAILMDLLRQNYMREKSPAQLKFADDLGLTLPKSMIEYLKQNPSDPYIDPHLLEFYVYTRVMHQIHRGRIFCNDSVSYCDLDHDLVDETTVDRVEEIAAEFDYQKIPIYCDQRLDQALERLDQAWEVTTANIQSGRNAGFKKKGIKDGKPDWSLLYDASAKSDDRFFRGLPKTEIIDVMTFIGEHVNIWDEFTHYKDRSVKNRKGDELFLNACILSEAFGFSTGSMSEMSDLNEHSMRATREDFVRVETLCLANDRLADFMNSLPIFKLWNLIDNKLLADADGQKLTTTNDTIQSRYSTKYFGTDPGLSICTLLANFFAVNAKNIGPNEYEGNSLYDMIFGNKTDVVIDMVTGDNHSLNQLNFVALDSIDVEYVPSIKNVKEAANNLYSVKPTNSYQGELIPKGTIDVDLIRENKRGILQVLLSLILQENSQTNIIRKLNSHTRYTRLRQALFEYNKIFRSTHILNLIDNMSLRKSIRTARNRTEAYHQLQSMIRKIYGGVFRGKKVVANRISAHATRLVANCIICYNTIILNSVYEKMLLDGVPQSLINEFAKISPISWTHLVFTGQYKFRKNAVNVDIARLAKMIEDKLKQKG